MPSGGAIRDVHKKGKMSGGKVRPEASDRKCTKGSFECMISIDRSIHDPFYEVSKVQHTAKQILDNVH